MTPPISLDRVAAYRSIRDEVWRVAGVVEVGTARNVDAALRKAINVPAVFPLYNSGSSKGRNVANHRTKNLDLDLSLIVVTEDFFSDERAHESALGLIDALTDRFDGFTPATCKKPLDYVRDEFVIQNGERVAYEVFFSTRAEAFLTPRPA